MDNTKHNRNRMLPGIILILLGIIFLIQQFVPDLSIGRLWPVILIVIGGSMLYNNLTKNN